MAQDENKVQREILDYINAHGFLSDRNLPIIGGKLFRVNNKGIRGRKSTLPLGYPDLVGYVIVKNLLTLPLYCEVKAEGKECANKDQLKFIKEARNDGCLALWANSVRSFRLGLFEEISRIKRLFGVYS